MSVIFTPSRWLRSCPVVSKKRPTSTLILCALEARDVPAAYDWNPDSGTVEIYLASYPEGFPPLSESVQITRQDDMAVFTLSNTYGGDVVDLPWEAWGKEGKLDGNRLLLPVDSLYMTITINNQKLSYGDNNVYLGAEGEKTFFALKEGININLTTQVPDLVSTGNFVNVLGPVILESGALSVNFGNSVGFEKFAYGITSASPEAAIYASTLNYTGGSLEGVLGMSNFVGNIEQLYLTLSANDFFEYTEQDKVSLTSLTQIPESGKGTATLTLSGGLTYLATKEPASVNLALNGDATQLSLNGYPLNTATLTGTGILDVSNSTFAVSTPSSFAGTVQGTTGNISGPLTLSSYLTPGAYSGDTPSLNFTGAVAFTKGGVVAIDLRGSTPGASEKGFDQVTTTGTLVVNNSSLQVTLGGTKPTLATYSIVIKNPTTKTGAVSGSFSNAPSGTIITAIDSPQTFIVNYAKNGDISLTVPVPTISTVSPNGGPATGGTSVIITGSGFINASSVTFGAGAISYVVNSNTQITATAPAGTGTVNVVVTTIGGSSANTIADDFTYAPVSPAPTAPTVTANGGKSLLDPAQPSTFATYSRVTSLELTFNTPISTVDPAAFTLSNGSNSISNNFDIIVYGLDTNVLTLSFPGQEFTPGVEFNSLADGIWSLTTDMTKIHAAGGVGTGNAVTNNIRRLFGDVNGTGTVDGGDFGLFGSTFGLNSQDPSFNPLFDVNGDGSINGGDFGPFGSRFGTGL